MNALGLTFADDLPETILADESLLRHVFSNLLSNAAKYSPEGISRAPDSGKNRAAHPDVSHRRQGHRHPRRLFQPFQRAGNVGQISGTGLGLMIAKRCAELHGGTLEVASTAGEGTTVTVALNVQAPTSASDSK